MTLRFDHAVIAVRDLEAASRTYTQLGFGVENGGRHTGKGTRNALVRFPGDYLELLAVDDRKEALEAGASRRDLVQFLDEHAAGLSTFALRTGSPVELDAFADRWRAAGIEVAGPNPAERRRPDGSILRWRTVVPGGSSVRRPWPFLIEWPDGALAGAPSQSLQPNGALGVAEVGVADVDVTAFDVLDRLGFETDARPDVQEINAVHRVVALPDCDVDVLVSAWPAGRVAVAIGRDGPGPFQVGIRVRDVAALEARLARSGLATEPAWPAGLRLAAPPPEAEMLVFLPVAYVTAA